MAEQATHPGLILGAARFYYNPRGSMRGVLNSRPSEAQLLVYAMIAVGILLAGRILLITRFAGPETDVMGLVSAQAVSLLFFVPLIYYGLAALGTVVSRVFGGEGGWREGRAAFFWAALVSAPVIALSSFLSRGVEELPVEATAALSQLGGVFFAWALAQCFAEAFGFRQTWLVFVAICIPVLVLIGATWLVLNA